MRQAQELRDALQQHTIGSEQDEQTPAECRRIKRLLRQKKAKVLQRAAAQESNHSETAEDYALEQAYEQHLRQLQQLHPAAAPGAAPTNAEQARQQQQQQRCSQRKGKRKNKGKQQQRQSGSQQQQGFEQPQGHGQAPRQQQQHFQPGQPASGGGGRTKRQRCAGWASPAVAGSLDTLGSSAALAVPAAQPTQQLAQISELSGEPAVAAGAAAAAGAGAVVPVLAWQPLAQAFQPLAPLVGTAAPVLAWRPLATLPAAGSGAAAIAAAQQQQWQHLQQQREQEFDSAAVAALVHQEFVQQQAETMAAQAAGKTAGICRMDLSAAALLISSHLAQDGGSAAAEEPAATALAAATFVPAAAAAAPWGTSAAEKQQQPQAGEAKQEEAEGWEKEAEDWEGEAWEGSDGGEEMRGEEEEEEEEDATEWATAEAAALAEGAAAPGGTWAGGEEAEAQRTSRRAQRRVYVHGNYHRYYGYRFFGTLPGAAAGQSAGGGGGQQQEEQQKQQQEVGAEAAVPAAAAAAGDGSLQLQAGQEVQQVEQQQQAEDPRLASFERRWFARRRCLDVGCNEGVVTLALVQRYAPRSMLGVDIDGGLVAKACRHLRELRVAAGERIRAARRAGVPADERKAARSAGAALSATRFVCADIVESEVEAGSVDTITCLSMTKWVHLNRGDDGLRAMFAAFWAALSRGGLLLLEPQPWSSYRAAAGKIRRDQAPPGSFFHRQDELRLRPDGFVDYLCDELGFRLVKRLGVQESAAGFDRPMLLLRKPV